MDDPKTLHEFAAVHGYLNYREREIAKIAARQEREACALLAASGVWDEEAKEWECSELIAQAIRDRK